MEQKKNLKSDETVERFRITQEIIECDNMIARLFTDPVLQQTFIDKRTDLQFELEQLDPEEL